MNGLMLKIDLKLKKEKVLKVITIKIVYYIW